MKRLLKNKKVIIIAAAALLVVAAVGVFLLRDKLFSNKDAVDEEPEPVPIEAPVQYVLNEVKVLAVPVGGSILVYNEEEPVSLAQRAAEKEAAEEETAGPDQLTATEESEVVGEDEAAEEEATEPEEEPLPLVAYRYEGMTDSAATVSAYTALLTTEDMGYVIADDGLKEAEEIPDLMSVRGTVYMTHVLPESEESEERLAVALCLDWEEGCCTVTAELVPASITKRPPEPVQQPGYMQTLTFSTAVDKMKTMHPSVLELEGESMEDYRIYTKDALVLINDQSCMRLDVYKLDKEIGTNVAAGNYFLSSDGLHLYAFNEKEQTVRELPMSAIQPTASASSGNKVSMPEAVVR